MSSVTESEEDPKKKTQIPKRTHKLKLKTRSILNLPNKVLAGAPPKTPPISISIGLVGGFFLFWVNFTNLCDNTN